MTQSMNNRWIFDLNRLKDSPSKRDGIGHHEELLHRQKGTNLIRDMSKELKLRPIVMNTAIVYFHRFFTLRSINKFNVNQIAVCSLFLSAKWEEQPIFKEHIIKLSFHCRQKKLTEELYSKECEKLVENENEMLLTFGFDLSVTHFQTVICTASDPTVINKTIQRNAYIIAGDLLRLSTICVEFPPNFAACICIYLTSNLLNIPISSNNWFQKIDPNLKLSDIEREAQKFKSFVNISRLSIEEKKRKQSFDSSNSPESAYSSGSGNSPDFDFLPKSEINSSDNNKTNNKSNHMFEHFVPNKSNDKRIRCQQNSSLSQTITKLKSKTNSVSFSDNLRKTKVLPNNSNVCTNGNSVHRNHSIVNRVQKYQKVVKPNGDVLRLPTQQTNTSTHATVKCAPKVVSHTNSSSDKQTTNTLPTIGNTFSCRKGFKKLNLKITFSTTDNSKSTDCNKRTVEPIAKNSTQVVKIES